MKSNLSLFLLLIFFSCTNKSDISQSKTDLKKFNIQGKVISVTESTFELTQKFGKNVKTNLTHKNTNFFNNDGYISKYLSYDWNNGYKTVRSVQVCRYNNSNQLVTVNDEKSGKKLSDCIYDNSGKLKEINTYEDNGKLSGKSIYKYNDDIVEETTYAGDGSLDYKITSRYDNGHLVEEEFIHPRNKYHSKSKLINNEKGLVEKAISEIDGKKETVNFKYTFDKNGNWITKTNFKNGIANEIEERIIAYKTQ